MNSSLHLTRDDSSSIAFVIACAFAQAIDMNELRAWADHVIACESSYPSYILDLAFFDGQLKDLYQAIGFVPIRTLSEGERAALAGIAFARGVEPVDCPFTRIEAFHLLALSPETLTEFNSLFPFLSFQFPSAV